MIRLSDVFWVIRLNDIHPDVTPYVVQREENKTKVIGILNGDYVKIEGKDVTKSNHAIIRQIYCVTHPKCDVERIEVASSGRTFSMLLLNHESDNAFYKDMVKYKKNQYKGDEYEFGRQFCSGLYIEREELSEIRDELEKGLMIALESEIQA